MENDGGSGWYGSFRTGAFISAGKSGAGCKGKGLVMDGSRRR